MQLWKECKIISLTAIFQNPVIHIPLAKLLCIKTSLLFAVYWSSFMPNVHLCLYMKPTSLIAHSGILLGQIHSCILTNSTSTTMGMAKCWIKVTERTKQIQWWCHDMKMYSWLLSLCERNPAVPGELIPQRVSNLEFWYHRNDTRTLGAVSIRKTVLPGMAIPMLKIRRPKDCLIFNMEIAIRR